MQNIYIPLTHFIYAVIFKYHAEYDGAKHKLYIMYKLYKILCVLINNSN